MTPGGPSQIVGQWRGTASALVRPRGPEATARTMAAAIDRFLADPPPVSHRSVEPKTSFEEEVLAAYDAAMGERDPATR